MILINALETTVEFLFRVRKSFVAPDVLGRNGFRDKAAKFRICRKLRSTCCSNDVRKIENRYAEAEPLLKRSLAIAEKALGPDGPTVAILQENLGSIYLITHKAAQAEPLLVAALAAKQKTFGTGSP